MASNRAEGSKELVSLQKPRVLTEDEDLDEDLEEDWRDAAHRTVALLNAARLFEHAVLPTGLDISICGTLKAAEIDIGIPTDGRPEKVTRPTIRRKLDADDFFRVGRAQGPLVKAARDFQEIFAKLKVNASMAGTLERHGYNPFRSLGAYSERRQRSWEEDQQIEPAAVCAEGKREGGKRRAPVPVEVDEDGEGDEDEQDQLLQDNPDEDNDTDVVFTGYEKRDTALRQAALPGGSSTGRGRGDYYGDIKTSPTKRARPERDPEPSRGRTTVSDERFIGRGRDVYDEEIYGSPKKRARPEREFGSSGGSGGSDKGRRR